MPRKGETQTTEKTNGFSKEEWLNRVKERIMHEPWGATVIKNAGALLMEIVRIGETENMMLRVRTPNVKNAIKLTRKEHIEALFEIAKAIVNNEKNLADKLEALKEIFPRGGRAREEEEL